MVNIGEKGVGDATDYSETCQRRLFDYIWSVVAMLNEIGEGFDADLVYELEYMYENGVYEILAQAHIDMLDTVLDITECTSVEVEGFIQFICEMKAIKGAIEGLV